MLYLCTDEEEDKQHLTHDCLLDNCNNYYLDLDHGKSPIG